MTKGTPGDEVVQVYTTQVTSIFRAHSLACSEVITQVLFTSEQQKKNKLAFVSILSQMKLLFGPVVYSAQLGGINLSVGESGGYLPRRFGSVNIHHYSPPLR